MREAQIWQSVLLVQIEDALYGPQVLCGGPKARARAIREARAYLTTQSKDLALVCSMAGMDMHAVIERMKARIAAAPSVEEIVATGRFDIKPRAEKPAPAPKRKPLKHEPFTLDGVTRTAAEWADLPGISTNALRARIKSGWPLAEALTMRSDEAQCRGRQQLKNRMSTEVARTAAVKRERARSAGLEQAKAAGRTWKRGVPETQLTHDGLTLPISEWAERTGLKKATIQKRLRNGWTIAEALDPTDMRGRPKKDTDATSDRAEAASPSVPQWRPLRSLQAADATHQPVAFTTCLQGKALGTVSQC